ncbi:hypothetical protein [Sphingobium sp.]|uniref:hypothetical protein n=1 Tax=Sphingobium sp. TaxID=1912891 RepID=UPI003BB683C7
MTVNLFIEQVHEVSEILLSFISIDSLELSLHPSGPVNPLPKGQGYGKGVGKLLDPDEIVKCLTICNLILICSHADVWDRERVLSVFRDVVGVGVQSIKTICLFNIPDSLNRTNRGSAIFRRNVRITGNYAR